MQWRRRRNDRAFYALVFQGTSPIIKNRHISGGQGVNINNVAKGRDFDVRQACYGPQIIAPPAAYTDKR